MLIFRSPRGKRVRAVMGNLVMAGAVGIDTGRVDRVTFGLGCSIAGIAGSAFTMSVPPAPPRDSCISSTPS
jgi:urea transport system permease protein